VTKLVLVADGKLLEAYSPTRGLGRRILGRDTPKRWDWFELSLF